MLSLWFANNGVTALGLSTLALSTVSSFIMPLVIGLVAIAAIAAGVFYFYNHYNYIKSFEEENKAVKSLENTLKGKITEYEDNEKNISQLEKAKHNLTSIITQSLQANSESPKVVVVRQLPRRSSFLRGNPKKNHGKNPRPPMHVTNTAINDEDDSDVLVAHRSPLRRSQSNIETRITAEREMDEQPQDDPISSGEEPKDPVVKNQK